MSEETIDMRCDAEPVPPPPHTGGGGRTFEREFNASLRGPIPLVLRGKCWRRSRVYGEDKIRGKDVSEISGTPSHIYILALWWSGALFESGKSTCENRILSHAFPT
jgi:hypothetical protein